MIRLAFFCIGFICLATGCQQKRQQSASTEAQDSLVQVGNDRDEHGCIASAGYVWSEVRKDCIRPFEEGDTHGKYRPGEPLTVPGFQSGLFEGRTVFLRRKTE